MEANIRWLDDPEVFRVGKLPAHSDHHFFTDSIDENSLMQSLNGSWKFHYSRSVKERPADFYQENYDAKDFDEIAVPGHIELAGYDKIHYINTMYPWEGHEFRRPKGSLDGRAEWRGMFSEAFDSPVGSYRKEFDLQEGLLEKRVIIRFEGVEQAMFLWLNGSFVGYSEDSFAPAEFDLTPYIREKGNVLAAEVYKRSTAAFLEDQDFFRFFGIFRNVTLIAKPDIHVEDLWAKPMLFGEREGKLSAELKISMLREQKGSVRIVLKDKEEKELLAYSVPFESGRAESGKEEAAEKENEFYEISVFMPEQEVGEVVFWDHKNPCLYRLEIGVYDEAGSLIETAWCSIGFRRIEIIEKVIYLNGKRLMINGVNRHEWSAESGRCIGREEMEQDMQCLLRNHINAVRTCHYPDQILWYELCDENGIYLMSETNLESHGSWQKMGAVEPSWNVPGSLPEWREAALDRAVSNFETFKNHPSVLFWSLGNESYAGNNIEAMNAYFKGKKDGRLVHYEGVVYNRSYEDTISDVESHMYAAPAQIREYLENNPKKPFILCEYMHNMGNSMGGLGSYMKLLDEFPMY